MIDKKTLLFIGVLVVVAIIVLAVGLVAPSLGGPSGSSFSALFDKMVEKVSGEKQLVLPNGTYAVGQDITVTDKIIAIASPNAYSTTLYFLYQGTTWANEEDGTSFDVITDEHAIHVRGAMFSIQLGTDLSVAFDVGDSITIQTQTELSDGRIVLGHDWALVDV